MNWDLHGSTGWIGFGCWLLGMMRWRMVWWFGRCAPPPRALTLTLSRRAGEGIVGSG